MNNIQAYITIKQCNKLTMFAVFAHPTKAQYQSDAKFRYFSVSKSLHIKTFFQPSVFKTFTISKTTFTWLEKNLNITHYFNKI